jgi:hypothetical protein
MFYKSEIYEAASNLRQIIRETNINVFLSILSKKEVNSTIADHLGVEPAEFYRNFAAFNKMQDFMEVLDSLIKVQCPTTCQESGGCSMCGTTKPCITIQCVREKNLNGCWECSGRDTCDKLAFQRMSYGKTIAENFQIINEQGIDAVPSRGDDYYEWQRRIRSVKR